MISSEKAGFMITGVKKVSFVNDKNQHLDSVFHENFDGVSIKIIEPTYNLNDKLSLNQYFDPPPNTS